MIYFQDSSFKYDIYLSYSREDTKVADMVHKSLAKEQKGLRIFSDIQLVNEEESWQEEIYEVHSY